MQQHVCLHKIQVLDWIKLIYSFRTKTSPEVHHQDDIVWKPKPK